jgi:hypothetical protein
MHLDTQLTLAHFPAYHVRRREPRYASSIPVSLKRFLRYGPVVSRGMSLDISVRGMSALVCGAPQVGETVVIELPLRHTEVEMLATVRHSSDAKSGFEFYPLSPIAQQGIQDWIEELRKHEEELFPYSYASAANSGSP